jgi:hypothetical protein
MKIPFSVLMPSLLALVIAAGCGPARVATISPTPSPPAVFDDSYGFLVGNTVRKESDPKPLFTLNTGDAALIVSPDGRHVAYEMKNELRVMDIAAKRGAAHARHHQRQGGRLSAGVVDGQHRAGRRDLGPFVGGE